jgi:hypothetical protein
MTDVNRPAPQRKTRTRTTVVLVVAAAVAAFTSCTTTSEQQTGRNIEPPGAYTPDSWMDALGGDGALNIDAVTAANNTSGLPDADKAAAVAQQTVTAETTGTGRNTYPNYFPPQHPAGTCTTTIVATLVAALPVDTAEADTPGDASARWAKTLVLWTGTCQTTPLATFGETVAATTIYLRDTGNGWEPVREGQIPQQPQPRLHAPPAPPQWALEPFNTCTATPLDARLEVVAAWKLLCDTATRAGVPLTATSALRTSAEQAERYNAAVRYYGNEQQARARIAYADNNTCESRHCSGTAIDVRPDSRTLTWLRAPAGCTTPDGTYRDATTCADNETVIRTMERYGFTEPLASSPGHLEFVLPIERLDNGGPCAAPPTSGAIEQIAAAWRCELTTAGLSDNETTLTIQRALATAATCSQLDPAWRYADGTYTTRPDPAVGYPRTEAGIFALPEQLRDGYSLPGENDTTVRGQAVTAARVYIAERTFGRDGWGAFGCSTTDIPAWARQASM